MRAEGPDVGVSRQRVLEEGLTSLDRGSLGTYARAIWSSTAIRLALVAFVVYNVNLRPISSADTFPTRYLPISILTEHNLDLDEFPFLITQDHRRPGADDSELPYYLQRRRGHVMSTYPVMAAVLATPVYALPVLLGLTGDPRVPASNGRFTRTEIVGTLLSKLTASLATAISVALVYWALLRLTTRRGAFWLSLGYAFGTSAWSVSSQGLWQSTMSQVLLAGTFLAFLKAEETAQARWVVLAGSLVALAVACRPTAIIFAVVLTLYAFRAQRQLFLRAFVPPVAVCAALLLSYNFYYFGKMNGGYDDHSPAQIFTLQQMVPAFHGLLLSPNRGILIFSPWLAAGFAGLTLALVRRGNPLLEYIAVATLLTIAFYSSSPVWDGSFSYSYRFLVDLTPGLALGAALAWEWIQARRWRATLFGGMCAASVGLQVVGAFDYPCGWYRSTLLDPRNMARIFDWRDLEVAQCLKQGPVESDGLRLIRGMRH